MNPRNARLFAALVVLLGFGALLQAQAPSGRVSGVLRDQSGAVLPEGIVEITDAASSLTRSSLSDWQGRYTFDALPAGRYQVAATVPGFETLLRDDVVVRGGAETVVDLVLEVARQETSVVVTAPAMSEPLAVVTDPRAPRQPIPAQDGADYLKAIPGFSLIRKGGTDGDPVLRGMAGSRLGILLDGQQILGGCGGRMDPPTAYVFPSAYDRITVRKGPQTVMFGPGMSAGAVLFEREAKTVDRPVLEVNSSLVGGVFGRHDEMVDVRGALPSVYVQGIATRSHSGDYRDGDGTAVHSAYTRWSSNAAFGWTPNRDTLLELSVAKSDGQVAYADRAMDGTKFARDNVALKFDRRNLGSVVQRVEVQSYYNYIDHVMDNFSLRTPGSVYSSNNPDRATFGGRAAVTLVPDAPTKVVVGLDTQRNLHTLRTVSGKVSGELATSLLASAARVQDMRFGQVGAFGEVTRILNSRGRLLGGFRADWHKAVDSRVCIGTSACAADSPLRNDTTGAADRRTLKSGFGRYELDIAPGGASTVYAGVGHVERFPDYWERVKQSPTTLKSAFLTTRPEKTTQLDAGMVWRSAGWSGSVSGFYGRIHDYILIRWMPTPSVARNVNATTMGGEAEVARRITSNLTAEATLAYVRSNNTTDSKPLAQQPPREARVGLHYNDRVYSFGALARLVGRQNRIDIGSGNIVANGMDLGPSSGFSVFSVNGGYRLRKAVLVTAGVDNLLNRTYAEHISKGGILLPGFVQTTRINEPGRTFWLKLNFDIE